MLFVKSETSYIANSPHQILHRSYNVLTNILIHITILSRFATPPYCISRSFLITFLCLWFCVGAYHILDFISHELEFVINAKSFLSEHSLNLILSQLMIMHNSELSVCHTSSLVTRWSKKHWGRIDLPYILSISSNTYHTQPILEAMVTSYSQGKWSCNQKADNEIGLFSYLIVLHFPLMQNRHSIRLCVQWHKIGKWSHNLVGTQTLLY